MSLVGNGRHIAEKEGWWANTGRGAKVGIITLSLLLIGALTAVAVLFTLKTSAPEDFSAKDVGNINIGNMETEGWIANGPHDNLEPGDRVTQQCFVVKVDNPTSTDIARWYVDSVSGSLADSLLVTNFKQARLSQVTPDDLAPGLQSCSQQVETTSGAFTTLVGAMSGKDTDITTSDTPLTALATTFDSFANGEDLSHLDGTVYTITIDVDPTADGETIAGTTASASFAWENQNP